MVLVANKECSEPSDSSLSLYDCEPVIQMLIEVPVSNCHQKSSSPWLMLISFAESSLFACGVWAGARTVDGGAELELEA